MQTKPKKEWHWICLDFRRFFKASRLKFLERTNVQNTANNFSFRRLGQYNRIILDNCV